MKTHRSHPMAIPRAVLTLAIGTLLVSPAAAGKPDMTPFSNANEYGCMYWVDGVKGQDFRIETSRFAMNYHHREFGPTAIGIRVDAPGEAANLFATPGPLPAAAFSCRTVIDGKEFPISAANGDPKSSMLVESGRFFQRRWQSGATTGFACDAARTGLETAAWPDRLTFVFRFSPTVAVTEGSLEMTLDLSTGFPVVARDGKSIGLADAHGRGFVVVPAAGADAVDLDATGRVLKVRSAPGAWQPGQNIAVGMVLLPVASKLAEQLPQVAASETTSPVVEADATLPAQPGLSVTYDKDLGWHRITLPKGTPGDDGCLRARIVVKNPHSSPRVIRFNFDGVPFYVPGITAVLRDQDGYPLGHPIQYSKNWHGKPMLDNPASFEGEWFHGLTMMTLPARSEYAFELMMVGENWGGMAAASHAQLSTIGYGGNQQWDQAALGNRGEALCYDMDHVLTDNDFTDSRPFGVLNPDGKRGWGINAGGGSVLRYTDAKGVIRHHTRMRVRYPSHGPNLARADFAGQTDDGSMDLAYSAAIFRADDCTRGFHHIRITVKKDTPFERLAFYQQAGDTYSYNQGDTLSVGNASTPVPLRTWKASGAPGASTGAPFPLDGPSPWVAITNANSEPGYLPANHGFIIRSWKARLGGRPADTPFVRERRNPANVSVVEVVPPPGITRFVPGDFVQAEILRVYVPRSADAYAGPNEPFRQALREFDNNPRMILREAAGNHITTRVTHGSLESSYPPRVRTRENRAAFSLTGGLGAVPVTFTGLGDYRRPVLEWQSPDGWKKVDQSIHGNDFWQCVFHPESQSWEITFTLRPDTTYRTIEEMIRKPETVHYRFKIGDPPTDGN